MPFTTVSLHPFKNIHNFLILLNFNISFVSSKLICIVTPDQQKLFCIPALMAELAAISNGGNISTTGTTTFTNGAVNLL